MSEKDKRPPDGGTVVIDIGAEVGAVVLYAPDRLEGDEIEVWPENGRRPLTHAVVRSRHLGGRQHFAAVFPALEAGEYTLQSVRDAAATPRKVRVLGGQVTEENW